ncbi:MAG TPA: hypothetical protein VM221_09840 [Armatimonadota bacterium]|nr:hypothetical protein [Armatimonadota bacterium]
MKNAPFGHRLTQSLTAALMVAVMLAALVHGRSPAAADPGAERAAETYLRALLAGDGATARSLSPTRPADKFGPCPFARMPRLEQARVDAHRAAVSFSGAVRDGELPDEGALVLTMLDDVKGNPWRVRQVAFFTEPPLGARIPPRSVTRRDEAQEPAATEAARRYLAAWLKGDYRTMDKLAFDWLARLRDRQPATIRDIEFDSTPAPGAEIKLTFTAKVILYRVLPKTLSGTLFAMREEGRWKIRSNELTF